MHRQVHGCQIGCAGLCLFAIGFDGAAYASPDVDLIRQFERNLYVGEADTTELWAVWVPIRRKSVAGYRGFCGHGWKIIGPLIAENCPSLGILGLGRLQVLVGNVDL